MGFAALSAAVDDVRALGEAVFRYGRDLVTVGVKPARSRDGGVFVEIEAYGDASPRGEPTCRFGLETVPARVVSSESFCSEYAVTIAEGQILPPGVYPTQNITLPHGQYARERATGGRG